jgi:pSer/pThr/pTyr-binding forkhead associated (FHA) protein
MVAPAAPAAAAPAPSPMAATQAVRPPSVPAPAPAPAPAAVAPSSPPAGGGVACPQCGHVNAGNRFCASCGYNLGALSGAAPSVPAAAAAAPAPIAGGIVLTALRADGSEAGTFRMPDAPVVSVGRDTGSIFAGDSYLSPRHATFSKRGGQLFIKDEGSLNGVYLKVRPNEPCLLEFGDVFRIGQEIIRFEELRGQGKSPDGVERFGSPAKGYIGRLALVIGRDTTGNSFPVPERGVHCGRERGDILFSEDGYVSGLHCRIARAADGRVYLTDVGSSNGTFVRLRAERAVAGTDILLMGQQLFRIDA